MIENGPPEGEVRARPHVKRTRTLWVTLAGSAVLMVAGGGLFLFPSQSAPPVPPTVPTAIVSPAAPPPASPPPPAPVVGTLGKRRTFQDALAALGVARSHAIQIVEAMRPHIDFRRLQPRDRLEVHHDASGEPVKLVYRQSPIDVVESTRSGDTWTATRIDVPVERRLVVVSGTLKDNLFESVERVGEQPQLVLDFAEIFAWDFDFAADSQPGDRFRMLVEKVFTGEQFVAYGRILAAEYESDGQVHTGVYFKDANARGYYTPKGESLRRAFLKSPLEFTRISSTFSRSRRHPILGGVRPHLAIDYAAPAGTPVWAVADGTVEYVGYKGGNGNTVIIRHRANFKTMYNHLSRFGRGIRAGVSVRQRQTIGHVGSTGLSTGPHLDYRVIKDGRFVNPLKQTFLPGQPISSSNRDAFTRTRDAVLAQLRGTDMASAVR